MVEFSWTAGRRRCVVIPILAWLLLHGRSDVDAKADDASIGHSQQGDDSDPIGEEIWRSIRNASSGQVGPFDDLFEDRLHIHWLAVHKEARAAFLRVIAQVAAATERSAAGSEGPALAESIEFKSVDLTPTANKDVYDQIYSLASNPQRPLLVVAGIKAGGPRLFVLGTTDPWIELWDVQERKETSRLDGLSAPIAFSRDGKLLAAVVAPRIRIAAEKPHDIVLLDLSTEKEVARLKGHTGQVTALSFAPDGSTLASSGYRLQHDAKGNYFVDGEVWTWTVQERQGKLVHRWAPAAYSSVALSPDGKHVVATGGPARVSVWDTATTELQWRGEAVAGENVGDVIFSGDGKTFACGHWESGRGSIEFWDIEAEKSSGSIPLAPRMCATRVSSHSV